MKGLSVSLVAAVFALMLLASVAPTLMALASALVPLIVVVGVVAVVLRLVFFHTRRF